MNVKAMVITTKAIVTILQFVNVSNSVEAVCVSDETGDISLIAYPYLKILSDYELVQIAFNTGKELDDD